MGGVVYLVCEMSANQELVTFVDMTGYYRCSDNVFETVPHPASIKTRTRSGSLFNLNWEAGQFKLNNEPIWNYGISEPIEFDVKKQDTNRGQSC